MRFPFRPTHRKVRDEWGTLTCVAAGGVRGFLGLVALAGSATRSFEKQGSGFRDQGLVSPGLGARIRQACQGQASSATPVELACSWAW